MSDDTPVGPMTRWAMKRLAELVKPRSARPASWAAGTSKRPQRRSPTRSSDALMTL